MATKTEIVLRGELHAPITVASSNRGRGVFLKQASSWIRMDLDTFESLIEAVDALFASGPAEPKLGELQRFPRPAVTTPAKWQRA